MKVKLITHTPEPEKVIATAAKLCYSKSNIDDLYKNRTPENTNAFLEMLSTTGHFSTFEHVTFTFAIEGVSRGLTHQLIRHRIASYSQQSQRYVKLDQFEYVIPNDIKNNDYLKKIFIKHMEESQKAYDVIADGLKAKYILEDKMSDKEAEKKAIENARYCFPNACCTKILVTMNVRSLLNFLEHRCCKRAQDEIRELAMLMREEVIKISPTIFKTSGASCMYGPCSEGKMSCGNPYLKKEVVVHE